MSKQAPSEEKSPSIKGFDSDVKILIDICISENNEEITNTKNFKPKQVTDEGYVTETSQGFTKEIQNKYDNNHVLSNISVQDTKQNVEEGMNKLNVEDGNSSKSKVIVENLLESLGNLLVHDDSSRENNSEIGLHNTPDNCDFGNSLSLANISFNRDASEIEAFEVYDTSLSDFESNLSETASVSYNDLDSDSDSSSVIVENDISDTATVNNNNMLRYGPDNFLLSVPNSPELNTNVEMDEFLYIGIVSGILSEVVTVVTNPGAPIFDFNTCVFIDIEEIGKKLLGTIFKVLGPVSEAIYYVHLNNSEMGELKLKKGTKVYAVPKKNFTGFVYHKNFPKMESSVASLVKSQQQPQKIDELSHDEKKTDSGEEYKQYEKLMNQRNDVKTLLAKRMDKRNRAKMHIGSPPLFNYVILEESEIETPQYHMSPITFNPLPIPSFMSPEYYQNITSKSSNANGQWSWQQQSSSPPQYNSVMQTSGMGTSHNQIFPIPFGPLPVRPSLRNPGYPQNVTSTTYNANGQLSWQHESSFPPQFNSVMPTSEIETSHDQMFPMPFDALPRSSLMSPGYPQNITSMSSNANGQWFWQQRLTGESSFPPQFNSVMPTSEIETSHDQMFPLAFDPLSRSSLMNPAYPQNIKSMSSNANDQWPWQHQSSSQSQSNSVMPTSGIETSHDQMLPISCRPLPRPSMSSNANDQRPWQHQSSTRPQFNSVRPTSGIETSHDQMFPISFGPSPRSSLVKPSYPQNVTSMSSNVNSHGPWPDQTCTEPQLNPVKQTSGIETSHHQMFPISFDSVPRLSLMNSGCPQNLTSMSSNTKGQLLWQHQSRSTPQSNSVMPTSGIETPHDQMFPLTFGSLSKPLINLEFPQNLTSMSYNTNGQWPRFCQSSSPPQTTHQTMPTSGIETSPDQTFPLTFGPLSRPSLMNPEYPQNVTSMSSNTSGHVNKKFMIIALNELKKKPGTNV